GVEIVCVRFFVADIIPLLSALNTDRLLSKILLAYRQKSTTSKARDALLSSPRRGRHGAAGARSGALQEQLALPRVARQRCRALKLRAGLVGAAELCEEVAAHARQEVGALKRRL